MPQLLRYKVNKKPSKVEADDNLIALIETLYKIDTEKPTAKLNETSITDNNGGRIKL